MSDTELHTLLQGAAATPSHDVDLPAVERRGRQLHRRTRLMAASGIAVAVVIAAVAAGLVLRGGGNDSSVQTPATRTDPRVFVDKKNGMSVRIPRGWHRDVPPPQTGIQRLTVRSAEETALCNGSRTPSVQISVMEIPPDLAANSQANGVPRPAEFGPDSGPIQLGTTEAGGCFATKGVAPGQSFSFTDKDRAFQVFLTLYPGTPEERQAQAYEILNSLRFVSDNKLDRPPLTLPSTPSTTRPRQGSPSEVRVLGDHAVPAEQRQRPDEARAQRLTERIRIQGLAHREERRFNRPTRLEVARIGAE